MWKVELPGTTWIFFQRFSVVITEASLPHSLAALGVPSAQKESGFQLGWLLSWLDDLDGWVDVTGCCWTEVEIAS